MQPWKGVNQTNRVITRLLKAGKHGQMVMLVSALPSKDFWTFPKLSMIFENKKLRKHFCEGAGIRKVWPIGPWSDQMVWSFLENFLKTFKVLQRSNHKKGLNWIHRMTELSNPPPFWSELFQIFKKKNSLLRRFLKLSKNFHKEATMRKVWIELTGWPNCSILVLSELFQIF